MSDVFTLRASLAAPAATVYRALTDPAALQTWLAEHAEVSLPDRRFEFWGPPSQRASVAATSSGCL